MFNIKQINYKIIFFLKLFIIVYGLIIFSEINAQEKELPHKYINNIEVNKFIYHIHDKHNELSIKKLHVIFSKANYLAKIVNLNNNHTKVKLNNWQEYCSHFLNINYINNGVNFWRKNYSTLNQATKIYGIPQEYIVAIIGIETMYGRFTGTFRVLDVLTTLAFDYPNNLSNYQKIFRENLESFLVWTNIHHINPMNVFGSCAGAIGIPQFMPTCIMKYAVDFDNSHSIDLSYSFADAIGSVGNFLKKNGWKLGEPVVWHLSKNNNLIVPSVSDYHSLKPHLSLKQLVNFGLKLDEPEIDMQNQKDRLLTLIKLTTPGKKNKYVLALHNFYVLTRYNHSIFYAMSVHELAQTLRFNMNSLKILKN